MDDLEQFLGGGQAVATPPKSSGARIPSDVQNQRDQQRIAILQDELKKKQELAAQGNKMAEADAAAILREIASTSKGMAVAPNKSTMTGIRPDLQPTADPLEAFLSNQPMPDQPVYKSTAGAGRGSYAGYKPAEESIGKTKQIRQKFFGKDISSSDVVDLSTTIPEESQSDLRVLYEVPRAIAQNLAAQVAGGYGAIATGLKGGTLEQADAVIKEIQEKYGYEPSSPISKKVLELLNLPIEYGLQPAAKFAGDITQKVTGSPTAGGVVAGTVEAAPMLLGLRKGSVPTKPGVVTEVSALDRQKAAMNDPNLPPSVRSAIAEKTAKGEQMTPEQLQATQTQFETAKPQLVQPKTPPLPEATVAAIAGAQEANRRSVGAAAVPDATTIQQALSVATPELRDALKTIPVQKVNIPTLQRHIEADSLPIPVRLTEGQATGDIVKISNEQNLRGKDPDLARRFNEQNGQLIENINEIRKNAAPDVYGTKTIENSQGIIDAYKSMDTNLNQAIDAKYKALRDASGGQFPVDAPKLLQNIESKLRKELLSNEAPKGQFSELQRLAKDNNMTFEDYLSLRRNLGDIARTAKDGAERKAASYMIEELEKLPLQDSAKQLKPLADQARKAARDRFQMLEKDPAYKAAVDDSVPADKFLDKFVINGVNKNINTMVQHLGKDSEAHQHMAAGTVNWLRDKAGVIDEKSNFSQKQYNAALKKLDDVNNLHEIFNPEAASQLKTLGNVANYTQFQPRGSFVNNSNTVVSAMARIAKGAGWSAEKLGNVAIPGAQLGTTAKEILANRALEAQKRQSLELGAGTKQTGKNKINNLNNP
jgi:hypothetical protein